MKVRELTSDDLNELDKLEKRSNIDRKKLEWLVAELYARGWRLCKND